MILDFCKRLFIATAIAIFIGILFIGATYSYASTTIHVDMMNSMIWPTDGELTDTFGTRGGTHYGIDIAAPEGTNIYSIDDGYVTRSYYSNTYGNVIFIEHPIGLETVYAHLNERLVNEGDFVYQGDLIGTVGNTGRSSGNHLHFEVHLGNWNIDKTNSIDPMLVLLEEPRTMAFSEEERREMAFIEIQEVLSMKTSLVTNEDDYLLNKMEGQDERLRNILSYTVERGDTLWALSEKYGVSVKELREINNLNNETLQIGQELAITLPNKQMYVVTPGDTLSQIANDSNVTVPYIKQKNGLETDIILPGMVLIVE